MKNKFRTSVKIVLASALLAVTSQGTFAQQALHQNKNNSSTISSKKEMKHELIALPYATDALEPVISKQTMELHHGKHHKGYVDTLNKLIEGNEFENMSLGEIVKKAEGKMYNQAGQILNHNLYWYQFAPNAGGEPTGKLAEAINKQWGSFEKFKEEFNNACTALFGSGWVWLAADKDGKLSIESEPNAGNPYRKGLNPLLGFDVWEHAYYLTYQNRRADHVKDLWTIVKWEEVANRYENPKEY